MMDALGDRMKGYEGVSKHTFVKRMPVIIRLDGKGFSKLTAPLKSNNKSNNPYHEEFHEVMKRTMVYLCENIQNVIVGYTQSDEISLLLKDWETLESQQYFGGSQSKIETVSASMCTGIFNHLMWHSMLAHEIKQKFGMFDARAFNIPKEDVNNYFVWRQKDAIRNSINMLGQHHFNHKRLDGLNTLEVKSLLQKEKNIKWDELPHRWMQEGISWKSKMEDTSEGLFVNFQQQPEFVENVL